MGVRHRSRTYSVMTTRLAVGIILGCSLGFGSASAAEPKAAPSVFTTNNYDLTVALPPGLFRCSYPPTWIGSDHGIEIYLSRPQACDPTAPEAAPNVPTPARIEIFYSFNVADISSTGGEFGPPRTNVALLPTFCPPSAEPLKPGSILLGMPATGCLQRQGKDISLRIGSLYSQDQVDTGNAPDSLVLVTLSTTRTRYAADIAIMREIVARIHVCVAPGRPPQPSRPLCPPSRSW